MLEERIRDARLRAYYVGFDQLKFRLDALATVIVNVIPEFALGLYQGDAVELVSIVPRLREAARRIYSTDQYQKRGEFGELVLHLLLRDFCRSVPLISKIYFKDTDNATVHGFDAVHAVEDGDRKALWLGESKLYDDGKAGVRELLNDLTRHLGADYLRREFALISTKLPEPADAIDSWRARLHEHQKLDTILDGLCIPLVCTYTSAVYTDHSDNTPDCAAAFLAESRELYELFEPGYASMPPPTVDVVLMLVPVASKAALVTELHRRLLAMQTI